jgi:hypothetical protein
MKTTFFTRLLAGSLITATIFTACSKTNTIDELNNGPQQTTAAARANAANENPYILNQDLKITYARDGATDITEIMDDWTLRFTGNYPSGEAQAWNDILARTGTWSMADASASTITLSYPPDISQLVFLNKEWTIGNVNRGSEIVLTAPDGDEVHLISKTQ